MALAQKEAFTCKIKKCEGNLQMNKKMLKNDFE